MIFNDEEDEIDMDADEDDKNFLKEVNKPKVAAKK